jgi:YidC/Oxa1 family membrane protein insertase
MSFISSTLEVLISHFYIYFNHWGWTILALAITVRALLFPLQVFTFKQQRLLAKIQPELDDLSKQHKDDPMKLFKAMGDVKKREGVKTGLTFLSSLVQLPLFMSIYKSFSNFHALTAGSFAWLPTLGAPDPLFIFPVVMAVTSYFQQRMAPQSNAQANPQMTAVMKFMPLMSLAFMVMMPSGLVFYYAVSGVLQLGGEMVLRRWC